MWGEPSAAALLYVSVELVEVFFQVYPGTTTREGTAIGIGSVSYTVQIGTNAAQPFTTTADGLAGLIGSQGLDDIGRDAIAVGL